MITQISIKLHFIKIWRLPEILRCFCLFLLKLFSNNFSWILLSVRSECEQKHFHTCEATYNMLTDLSQNVCEYIMSKKEKDRQIMKGSDERQCEGMSLIRDNESNNEREERKICFAHKMVCVIKRSLIRCEVFWFEVLSLKILPNDSQSQIVWINNLQWNSMELLIFKQMQVQILCFKCMLHSVTAAWIIINN